MKHAMVFPATGGEPYEISFPEGTEEAELKALQEAVGGYIEGVYIDGDLAYVNEEGLILGLPYNEHFPWLVGNVVIPVERGVGR